MNLFAIESSFAALDAMLEESQGVITPEIESYLESIQAFTIHKIFDLQTLREQCQAFAKLAKEKSDEYAAKAKVLERRDEMFKSWQIRAMSAAGQKSMTNGVYKITLVQNPLKVEVVDESVVPSSYQVAEVKMTMADYEKVKSLIDVKSVKVSIDKKSIGDIYKAAGVEVSGVEYHRDDNVRVS